MVRDFGCKKTEKIFNRQFSRKFPADIQRIALRKLALLDAAESLDDLQIPPSNCLEKLTGDRKGQHSIRITISGVYVSYGPMGTRTRSKSQIIIRGESYEHIEDTSHSPWGSSA